MRCASPYLALVSSLRVSSSQILVVRGSLFVLNVALLRPLNATISELLGEDIVTAEIASSAAAPVPVHSADELETSDLLISEVSDNLQHFSTVAIETEDFQVHESRSVDAVLK